MNGMTIDMNEHDSAAATPRQRATRYLMSEMRAFGRDEDGAMLLFALSILVVMLMVAGMAVDLAIVEDTRVRMQQTADRAVLAAADLDQPRDAQEVVDDYFLKAGLDSTVTSVKITEGLNFRRVEANTLSTVDTTFMHMLGIDSLDTPSRSVAEERITDIEISLVLDVSGSMGSNSRLTNLKTAAANFFDAVVDEASTQGVTSVSIIPYNHVVNVGDQLLNHLNPDTEHEESHCIRFRDDDFDSIAISPTTPLERVAHFHYWTNGYREPKWHQYWCKDENKYEIMVHETRIQQMKNYVNALQAGGWTATDNGMKWAAALLDPAIRPAVNNLVTDGVVQSKAANRPADYNNDENMKVIVLMTDGSNTEQRDISDAYKTGMSDVYRTGSGSNWSDWYTMIGSNPSSHRYYRPMSPYGNGDDRWVSSLPSGAQRVSNQDLYIRFSLDDAANYLWKHGHSHRSDYPTEFWNRYNNVMNRHDRNTQIDDRMKDMCDTVKNAVGNETQIFTIGFEAPSRAEAVLKDCASTAAHFYDIDGTDINVAFQSIANTINRLRLTQ